MEDQKDKVNPTDAREASMSRVTTLDTILKTSTEEPASEVVAESEKESAALDTQDGKPKVKQTRNDRIQELANSRREAVKAAEAVKQENEELRARIKALETTAAPLTTGAKPDRADFASEDQYTDALVDWKLAKREQDQQEAKVAVRVQEVDARFSKTLTEAKLKYSDFDDVVKAKGDVRLDNLTVLAIKDSPLGGEITYYLAKHSDELEKLNDMLPNQRVKFIDKLERDLLKLDDADDVVEAVKPLAKKKAPEPITPVSGTNASVNVSPKDFESYRAKRRAEQAEKRR